MSEYVEVQGLDDLARRAKRDHLLAQPLRSFFQSATILVQGRARTNCPVDTGRLRNSITTEIDVSPVPLWGKIGTNVTYAKPVEYGTGLLSEAPDSKRRRYFPPPKALDLWARRHGGGSGYRVAKAIYNRGGTHPKRFLRDALRTSVGDINGLLARAASDIQSRWQS